MNKKTAFNVDESTLEIRSVMQNTECPQDLSQWFAMRCTYSRELKAKALFDAEGIECFLPMKKDKVLKNADDAKEVLSPAIHNLIFVKTTRTFMNIWKRQHEDDCPLRYMMDKSSDQPIIVREKEMEDFIRVTKESQDSILYLDNPNVVQEKGQLVEIAVGPLKGVRGHIVRIRRDRRVVVSITGLLAVALVHLPLSHFIFVNHEKESNQFLHA